MFSIILRTNMGHRVIRWYRFSYLLIQLIFHLESQRYIFFFLKKLYRYRRKFQKIIYPSKINNKINMSMIRKKLKSVEPIVFILCERKSLIDTIWKIISDIFCDQKCSIIRDLWLVWYDLYTSYPLVETYYIFFVCVKIMMHKCFINILDRYKEYLFMLCCTHYSLYKS